MRVEQQLRMLGVTGRISYKPDIYTTLGIYHNNPHKLTATVYSTNHQQLSQSTPMEVDED